MFKFILQIILLFLLARMLFPLFRGMGSAISRLFGAPGGAKHVDKKPDYSALTPYEIEDADYEDIPSDRE